MTEATPTRTELGILAKMQFLRGEAGTKRLQFLGLLAFFLLAWYFPLDWLPEVESRLGRGLVEAAAMMQDYAHEHVLLCLIPAFFIAGAISVFVSQASVMKYLGPTASKWVAYPVASVSGTILAVCSCTVLPLFAGIHKRGAGLGPAAAFLYSGPAINVLAIILTARVLGPELGIARAVGAVVFAVVIGLTMHLLYRREEAERAAARAMADVPVETPRKLWQDGIYFAAMVAFLVFANWGRPADGETGFWAAVFAAKWWIAGASLVVLAVVVWRWFQKDELAEWGGSTWTFTLQITPLLFAGVLVAGFLLGRPGHEALIPSTWVESLVGGNSLEANLFASVSGAFMYFATLTEVPILEGLIGAGMGKGPALSLLLAGPALSLPSMLVIRSVLGTKKTVTYVAIVVVFSTLAGWIYGTVM
jgi:hypothetical protein